MPPALHVVSPAPLATPPLTALVDRGAPSVSSGVIVALILLALVLQASFLAGLASGPAGAPERIVRRPVVALVR